MVDYFGDAKAAKQNVAKEYERNIERYRFLRWGGRPPPALRATSPAAQGRRFHPSQPSRRGPLAGLRSARPRGGAAALAGNL
jgi:hypothetical protein